MFRSRTFWAIILGVVSSILIFLARIDLAYSPLWGKISHALTTPGAHFATWLYPSGGETVGWARLWRTLAIACNFVVYAFFWYACIWLTSYFRARQHPYESGNTLVPPGI